MNKNLTIPNTITFIRALFFIPMVWYFLRGELMLASIYVIAFLILDIADGFLARRLNQETELGMKFDPAVDGVFSFTLILLLFFKGYYHLYTLLLILIPKGLSFFATIRHVQNGKKKFFFHYYVQRPVGGFLLISFIILMLTKNSLILDINAVLYFVLTVIYTVMVYRMKKK